MSSEADPLINNHRLSISIDPLSDSIPIDNDVDTNLELAANAVYEAIVEDANYEVVVADDDDDDANDEDILHLREQRLLNKSTHWFKRPSVLIVSFITFLLAFASSSGESSRQVIQYKLACNSLARLGKGVCDPIQTQVLVSNYQIVATVAMGITSSIAAGKIGALSDQYGRKPFIIAIAICFAVGRFCKFLVMSSSDYLQFTLMILCEILASLCGGVLSFVTITNCYISDVVEINQRIYSLGIGMACLFLGLSTGPIAGNLVLALSKPDNITRAIDTSLITKHEFLPLKFELLILLIVIVYSIFVLPESRSEKARKKSRTLSITEIAEAEPTTWSSMFNFLKPLRMLIIPKELKPGMSSARLRKERIALILLVFSDWMLSTMAIALGELFVLYGLYKFDWNQTDIGHLLAAACSSKAVSLILFSPLLNHKILQNIFKFRVLKRQYDMIDFSMAFFGLSLDAVIFVFISLAPNNASFLFFIVLTGLGTIASPTLNSAIVKFFPESKFGEVFGAMALLKNLAQLAGPITFLTIYKTTLAKWNKPEVVFQVCAVLIGVLAILQIIIKRVLNLTSETCPQTSRTSSVSSFNQILYDSNSISKQPSITNYTELHRKNSFVHSERNQK